MIRELLEARAGEEYELYARTINPQFMRVLKTIEGTAKSMGLTVEG